MGKHKYEGLTYPNLTIEVDNFAHIRCKDSISSLMLHCCVNTEGPMCGLDPCNNCLFYPKNIEAFIEFMELDNE